jgi:hypothetical protein
MIFVIGYSYDIVFDGISIEVNKKSPEVSLLISSMLLAAYDEQVIMFLPISILLPLVHLPNKSRRY